MYRKKLKLGKVLYYVAFWLLVAVCVVSAWFIADYYTESVKQKEAYDELAAIVESIQAQVPTEPVTTPTQEKPEEPTGETQEETQSPTTPDGMFREYAALYEMNDDIVGWMKLEGTPLNYPVMQTPTSPDYYLYRNFAGEHSSQGSLYVREECDVNAPSDNLTIYGHNMRDGSMFNCLLQYEEKEFWENHQIIIFDTLTERHTYQVFAVFKTTASVGEGFTYHRFVDAESEQEFRRFVASCKGLSYYDTGITPTYGDKIICLSTCEYTLVNGRFVVAAYRIS